MGITITDEELKMIDAFLYNASCTEQGEELAWNILYEIIENKSLARLTDFIREQYPDFLLEE